MSDASSLYVGEAGKEYWERNERVISEEKKFDRYRGIAELYRCIPPRLELGCGKRWNLGPYDIGIDIDQRNHPHMVWDVRDGIPFTDKSFPVVFCVGLLMHFQQIVADEVLKEMGRVAVKAVIIGEYVAEVEKDLRWDYHNGSFGNGEPGLLWERPYDPPPGFHLSKSTKLEPFGDSVTFLVFERNGD